MSRGFVREGDQEEAPFIPPRAALPDGEINYVTPKGMEMLLREKDELEGQFEKNRVENEKERRHLNAITEGKLSLLIERINSARILEPSSQPKDEVRFGALVKLQNLNGPLKGKKMDLTIVGVDEADVKKQKIAFVSPLAKAAAGKRIGEDFDLQLGSEIRKLRVLDIHYT